MNIQDWFPLRLTGLISLQSKGLWRVFSNITVWKHWFFSTQLSLWSNSHPYMTTGKTIALTRRSFVGKVMSLFFNMLSRLVITFLPRSKRLLILLLQSPSAVILEPRKINSAIVSTISLSICHEAMVLDAIIFVFWMLNFKPAFHSPLSLSSRGSLVLLCFLPQFLVPTIFLQMLAGVDNLISGSSAFSKSSLNFWKFMVHVLLKPNLENFEHYFASMWDECNCAVVWALFGIAFLWDWNENWPFHNSIGFDKCIVHVFTIMICT